MANGPIMGLHRTREGAIKIAERRIPHKEDSDRYDR
jgi:hypothetical protein